MARGSQPPRPAPRASKAPSRGGAKGGAARGGAKGGAQKKAAQSGVRKAAPGKAMPRTGGRQPAGRGATAEQLRQQRLMLDQQRRSREARWWAINQHALKDLHSRQHHAAGGEAIGTTLNGDRRMRWRTSHAVGAITLLILSFFLASMAVGAQSVFIAVTAFACFAGCIAFVTVEHSARRFPQPVPAPPLIGQHRLEDLIVEDDPPRPAAVKEPAPSSLDDLFEPAPRAETPAAAPVPEPVQPAEPARTPEPLAVVIVEPVAAEPEPADHAVAAVPPGRTLITEPIDAELIDDEDDEPAGPPAVAESAPLPNDPPANAPSRSDVPPAEAFTLPSEQIGGDASAAPAPPPADPPSPRGPIAEAVTKLKNPSPPRQRTSTEGSSLADDLAELLLSEQRLDGTDVTDVAATLIVADLQRSVEFYTDALGLHIADRTEEAAILDAGFGKILLWERPDAPPGETGVMHLTFEVGDLDATFAEMNQAGVEFLHLPRTALLGQNYEMRAAAFRDPDGHGLAITEHRERD
ncbi:VOC family protein [Glycomyces luteolus]|uniref:VOC family protein n=1 Tax=Glycomyces luteolus TaxID=2670330 RepID=A0A9X3SSB9_9ACTN|nr:VOC family protein [Glycomyces luteolus]MDA1359143.1 VOC family protein [Glycomyces luteolus]